MKEVWKECFNPSLGTQHRMLPEEAKIVHTGIQNGLICIWFECNPNAIMENREFEVFGTGYQIPPEVTHIGTVHADPFMWHLYERKKHD